MAFCILSRQAMPGKASHQLIVDRTFMVVSIRGCFESISSAPDPLPLRQVRHPGTIELKAARPFVILHALPLAGPAFDFEFPSRPLH